MGDRGLTVEEPCSHSGKPAAASARLALLVVRPPCRAAPLPKLHLGDQRPALQLRRVAPPRQLQHATRHGCSAAAAKLWRGWCGSSAEAGVGGERRHRIQALSQLSARSAATSADLGCNGDSRQGQTCFTRNSRTKVAGKWSAGRALVCMQRLLAARGAAVSTKRRGSRKLRRAHLLRPCWAVVATHALEGCSLFRGPISDAPPCIGALVFQSELTAGCNPTHA
mgnify:CR=1 FL=1